MKKTFMGFLRGPGGEADFGDVQLAQQIEHIDDVLIAHIVSGFNDDRRVGFRGF